MLHDILMPQHLLIILIVALFIFGPKKLPELGHGLGKGIRSFKDSLKSATSTEEPTANPEAPAAKTTSELPK
ncbi:MAG: Sec-independent protein translocase subunit TatA/TatB [Bryobacteraceae bacterium]